MITLRDEKFFKEIVKVYKLAAEPTKYNNTNERGFAHWLKENYNCRKSSKGTHLIFRNDYDTTMFLLKFAEELA